MNRLNHKEIGSRIRAQRELLHLTREQLAKKIGITSTFLTDIELGNKGFSLKSLDKFSEILKLSSDTILYGTKKSQFPKYTGVLELLEQCPEHKLHYAEEFLSIFLLSQDD